MPFLGLCEFDFAKHRAGALDRVYLTFIPERTDFEEFEREHNLSPLPDPFPDETPNISN